MKKVVYFAARACSCKTFPQPGEIEEACFFEVDEAMQRLTYPADKHLLRRVLRYLDAKERGVKLEETAVCEQEKE